MTDKPLDAYAEHERYLAIALNRALKARTDRDQFDLGTTFLQTLARVTVRLDRLDPEVVVTALDPDEIALIKRTFRHLATWFERFEQSSASISGR